MKLPSMLEKFLPKKPSEKELYASLVLDQSYAAAAIWEMGDKGVPNVLSSRSALVSSDTWEARLNAIDESLADVEDDAGTTQYTKVVLGLPLIYLTESGEIKKEIRPEVKKITHELELTPIGFVSIPQALLYKIKTEEGVPPSVILLGVTKTHLTISLYRVGVLTGQHMVDRDGDIAIQLEEGLKQFKHLEVLPARVLLYGFDEKHLEEAKTDLLRYPWTTRVNFLHFPKIEIVSPTEIAGVVALAGASELASEVTAESDTQSAENEETDVKPAVVPVSEPPMTDALDVPAEGGDDEILESEAEATYEAEEEAKDIEEGEQIREEEQQKDTPETAVEPPNVVAVDPSRLGFRKNVDVLEEVEAPPRQSSGQANNRVSLPVAFPAFISGVFARIDLSTLKERIITGGKWPIIAIAVVLLFAVGLLYWFVPRANVTVYTLPTALTASETITIDPTTTTVTGDEKIIPGFAQEKSVNGTKTIPVTGKKNVGEPAKGSVTIYNKKTESKSFSKGTVLVSGSLQFTLDSDIQIASASESVGSITFGKSTGAITASQIGTESNLPASTEFRFKDMDTSVASARNDSALTGGTSKSVTVVSRADQDELVKAVSAELVDQAKGDLSGSVTGSQKLIDGTITTAVTQKTFNQELDQEATELTGSATVTVSGTAYNEEDVKALLSPMITGQIPTGYTLAQDRTKVTLENVKVAKTGKITAKAIVTSDAIPTLDTGSIQKNLAGKSITTAKEFLKNLTGVAGAEIRFGLSFSKSRLPMNAKNITVGIAIQ